MANSRGRYPRLFDFRSFFVNLLLIHFRIRLFFAIRLRFEFISVLSVFYATVWDWDERGEEGSTEGVWHVSIHVNSSYCTNVHIQISVDIVNLGKSVRHLYFYIVWKTLYFTNNAHENEVSFWVDWSVRSSCSLFFESYSGSGREEEKSVTTFSAESYNESNDWKL